MKRAVLAALAVLFAFPLLASPNDWQQGQEQLVTGTLLCDTAKQVEEILSAHKRGPAESAAAMRRLNAQINDIGEPSCVFIRVTQSALVRFQETVGVVTGVPMTTEPTDLFILRVLYNRRNDEWAVGFIYSDRRVRPGEPA